MENKLDLERMKRQVANIQSKNQSHPMVVDMNTLIKEVGRLRDVHDHYLFELDRANKLKKENAKLLEELHRAGPQ